MTETKTNISDLIKNLREIRDQKDALAQREKELNRQEDAVETQLLAAMEAAGFSSPGDKVSSEYGTATRQQKFYGKCDPEKWPEFFKWAVANDRTDIFHRRMTDAKIVELVDLGYALPDGVTVESRTQLSFRRS
jgi:hypothetical protein